MSGMVSGSLSSAPNGQIIDFDRAELRRVPFQDSLYLWVSVHKPDARFELRLAPRIYHDRPDFWGIEVIAVQNSNPAIDTVSEPLAVVERSVPLVGIVGTRGITVIGANRSQHIEIDDGSF